MAFQMSAAKRFIVRVSTIQRARAICSRTFIFKDTHFSCVGDLPDSTFFGFDEDRFFCVCDSLPSDDTDYYVLSSDEVTALRLEFEMRAYGVLCGPDFNFEDAVIHLTRQSERYFGFREFNRFSESLANALVLSMARAADRGYIFANYLGCHPHNFLRLYESNAMLYEEIAKLMYFYWFDLIDICPIPFQYPDLQDHLPALDFPSLRGPVRRKLSSFSIEALSFLVYFWLHLMYSTSTSSVVHSGPWLGNGCLVLREKPMFLGRKTRFPGQLMTLVMPIDDPLITVKYETMVSEGFFDSVSL